MLSARFWPKAYSLFLYAYHWGLEAARKHLRELGAPEPEMRPFDPSKHEPMPEVEIDPEDEFHMGAQTSRNPEE
jgi:hypothetical protein